MIIIEPTLEWFRGVFAPLREKHRYSVGALVRHDTQRRLVRPQLHGFLLAGLLLWPPLLLAGHGLESSSATEAPAPPAAAPPSSKASPLEALQALGADLLGSETQNAFLDPDAAYVMSARVEGADTVSVHFDIADGYYLYRKKFRFTADSPPGVAVARVDLPPGKEKVDEFFGAMRVFYHEAEAAVHLSREAGPARDVTLEIGYQGCADAGLCYPPMTKQVVLSLPPGGGRASAGSGAGEVVGALPEQDRIARSLAGGSPWLALAAFFGFGLLLTFTPCVFPMIPILSGIIVGQGANLDTRRAFSLSLTYVLGMAATYTAAGVVAGLTGANLQAVFQDPWVLGAFSLVFVALALSMFGLYDLQVPAAWQSALARLSARRRGGTYAGALVMGVLSALIVGPCVAAPLAGALIYIGQTGDATLGGVALFALSMGMGAPLLVVGTSAGKFLPKAGPWMKTVKAVFGVGLLAVAIYLMERVVPGPVAMLAWAALAIGSAVFMGAFDRLPTGAGRWRRLAKGAGLMLGVYGAVLVVGAAGGATDPLDPLRGLSLRGGSVAYRELEFQAVKGPGELRKALSVAVAERRPVMLDYYADWCVSCKELEKYTFSDPRVRAALGRAVLLRTDVTANDAEDQALLGQFDLFGPPAILFFGPDGRERPQFRVVGFVKAERFAAHVERAIGRETGGSP